MHLQMWFGRLLLPETDVLCVCAFVHTVDVFDHVDAEAVSGDGGEHLASTPPPGQVVRRTPGGDGTKQ